MAKGAQERLVRWEAQWRPLTRRRKRVTAAVVVVAVAVLLGWLVSLDWARTLLLVIGIGVAAGAEGSQLAQRSFAWADRVSSKTPDEREEERERRADEFPPAGFVIGVVSALVIYAVAKAFGA